MKRNDPIGRTGFTFHGRKVRSTVVNLDFIQEHMGALLREGKIEKKGDVYIIDAGKLGWQKILGSGHVREKLHITVQKFSEKAKEKIERAKGTIINQEQ